MTVQGFKVRPPPTNTSQQSTGYPIAFGLPATVPNSAACHWLPEIVYSACIFLTRHVKKQHGMLAFFRSPSYVLRPLRCLKITENVSTNRSKIGKNGGLGWFWGLLGEILGAFGPPDGPKLKKAWKSEFVDPPQGVQLGVKIWEKSDLEAFCVFF